jgi:hypothetical protein
VLNAGTKLEGAAAISLDSLAKLQATKAADKKTTLMDALVMLTEKKFGADILSWPDDLKDTTAAARVELPELKAEPKADGFAEVLPEHGVCRLCPEFSTLYNHDVYICKRLAMA